MPAVCNMQASWSDSGGLEKRQEKNWTGVVNYGWNYFNLANVAGLVVHAVT